MNKWIFLAIIFVFNSNSKPYLLHHIRTGNAAEAHYISKLDSIMGSITESTLVGPSSSQESFVATDKTHEKLVVYLPSSNNDAELVVFDSSTLKELLRIKTDQMLSDRKFELGMSPLFISQSGNNIVMLADNNEPKILVFDINSGKELLSRSLINGQSKINLSYNKTFLYVLTSDGAKNYFTAIDIEQAKSTAFSNLGSLPVVTHIHHNTLLISTEKKTQRRSVYELFQIDFKDGEKHKVDLPNSEYHYVFTGPDLQGKSYVGGKYTKKKRDLFVAKIDGFDVGNLVFQKRKIIPRSMVLSGDGKVIIVLGEDKMATIDSMSLSLKSKNRLPFDVLKGLLNHKGTLGIIQENSGSEIGFVDTVKGDIVKQIGAGRFIAKSGNFIATHITGGIVAMVVDYFESSKKLQFNHDESRLIVINSNSNDITVFDTEKMKKLFTKSTGTLTQLMLQFEKVPDVVLTMNRNQINLFNIITGEELIEIKQAVLVGYDQSEGMIFYQKSDVLHQLDLNKLKKPVKYLNTKALGIYNL